ncbi:MULTISPECIES: hypothetical protein [unclassified Bradyrhizobium]
MQTFAGEIKPPCPGGHVFTFREIEHPDGGAPRTLTFTEVDIKPRSYEELDAAKLHQAVTIPLEMYNGRILETDVEGVDLSKYAHITAMLESPFTAQAIGLVRGGWLPSVLAATRDNAVVFPDRNIISELSGRFAGGHTVGREPDFLDLFAGSQVKINPTLAAMEGNGRALSTPDEAREQLDEAVAKLKSACHKRLMVGPDSLKGLLGLIEDMRPGLERNQARLKALAPSLCKPTARREIDARWNTVLEAADAHQVPRSSLLVLALLSALVHPTVRCASKRLLKLHDSYTDGDAYNALSDLRALELLLYALAFFPDFEAQICTKDRQLALFWVGAGAHDIKRAGVGIRCSLTPHVSCLPRGSG